MSDDTDGDSRNVLRRRRSISMENISNRRKPELRNSRSMEILHTIQTALKSRVPRRLPVLSTKDVKMKIKTHQSKATSITAGTWCISEEDMRNITIRKKPRRIENRPRSIETINSQDCTTLNTSKNINLTMQSRLSKSADTLNSDDYGTLDKNNEPIHVDSTIHSRLSRSIEVLKSDDYDTLEKYTEDPTLHKRLSKSEELLKSDHYGILDTSKETVLLDPTMHSRLSKSEELLRSDDYSELETSSSADTINSNQDGTPKRRHITFNPMVNILYYKPSPKRNHAWRHRRRPPLDWQALLDNMELLRKFDMSSLYGDVPALTIEEFCNTTVLDESVQNVDELDLTFEEITDTTVSKDKTESLDENVILTPITEITKEVDLMSQNNSNIIADESSSDIFDISEDVKKHPIISPLKPVIVSDVTMICQKDPVNPYTAEDKENVGDDSIDTTIISDEITPVKRPRESILQLFDPYYSSKNQVEEPLIRLIPTEEQSKEPKDLLDLSGAPEEIAIKKLKEFLDAGDEVDYNRFVENLPQAIKEVKQKMENSLENSIKCEEEMTALKLELNQLQQDKSSLELELHQKDEVILKSQGEAQKRENCLKQEIKNLNDKLALTNDLGNNEELQTLKSENISLKKREQELLSQLNLLSSSEDKLKSIMTEYESTFSQKVNASQKLKEEHDTAKRHLATLEMSFSDLHTKYERSKDIIAGYKDNEETLLRNLEAAHEGAIANEGRYNMLKAHAKSQLDKSNKEILILKKEHQLEVNKLTTITRRLEIKVESIQQALDQKNIECSALAALCDEVTGSIPQ